MNFSYSFACFVVQPAQPRTSWRRKNLLRLCCAFSFHSQSLCSLRAISGRQFTCSWVKRIDGKIVEKNNSRRNASELDINPLLLGSFLECPLVSRGSNRMLQFSSTTYFTTGGSKSIVQIANLHFNFKNCVQHTFVIDSKSTIKMKKIHNFSKYFTFFEKKK